MVNKGFKTRYLVTAKSCKLKFPWKAYQ